MKKLWMRAIVGTAIAGGIGGATVAAATAFNDSEAPEVSAEQALQEVFSKVEGTVQEVELGLEDRRYYEVEVESSVREYEFLIDAASGEFLAEEPDQENSSDDEFHRPVDATDYAEHSMIEEQVDTGRLTYHLATDNPGSRILFLLDEDGEKQFKTIFLKHSRELEIIDLSNGEQVYRGDI
ncbi:PepSY domain-containing protein [Planococcus plakortidis]